ncbi:hypothetical protein PN466_09175 [Roseofilum reptotaenium CS-1145]|nr:hypothetical protein [Roseofilum reptotaenium CS-1145]
MIVILPLRTIALQILCLWVAIAIESYFLHTQLQLHPRFSIFYAATLNLLANLIGWFLFFNLELLLPNPIRQNVIDLVLFGQWERSSLSWILLAIIGAFLIGWFVKRQGLALLRNIRKMWIQRKYGEGGFSIAAREAFIEKAISRTVFNAHLMSNSVILLVVLMKFIRFSLNTP